MKKAKLIMFVKIFIFSLLVILVTSYAVKDDVQDDVRVDMNNSTAKVYGKSGKVKKNPSGELVRSMGCGGSSGVILADSVRIDGCTSITTEGCILKYGKTAYISFTFEATQALSEASSISYGFCGTMLGLCFNDPDLKAINFCDSQLNCPLTKGNTYSVTVEKKLPNLFFRMSIVAQVSLKRAGETVGCIATPLVME